MEKIGFAVETVYGVEPKEVSPITLLPVQRNILVEAKRTLTVDARFDCPCCGKGITIQIDKEI